MTTSADRTIIVGRPFYRPLPLRWPTAQPGDDLDYSLDLTEPLCDVHDSIASASLTTQPSGTGELQASNLSVLGDVVTVWLSGGIPTRDYIIAFTIRGLSGRSWVELVDLNISPRLGEWPPPPAPDIGPGEPITWNLAQRLGLGFRRPLSIATVL